MGWVWYEAAPPGAWGQAWEAGCLCGNAVRREHWAGKEGPASPRPVFSPSSVSPVPLFSRMALR